MPANAGIHVFLVAVEQGVDGRDKPGHDGGQIERSGTSMRLTLSPLALFLAFVASAAAQTLEQVKVGTTNVASDVGFFIAEQKGYFRDAGIAVTTTTFASAAKMIAPLGTGEIDVGGGTVAAGLYNAVERGINIKVVADKASVEEGYEYSTLLVRKDLADSSRYKSLADLKGMTVATASQGAGSESALNEALKKGGLKFTDVNVVYMGFPEMLVALRNKAIDAGVTNEPTVTRAIEQGFAVRASRSAIYPGQQTAVVLYADGFITKRRPVAQKLMSAYIRALRDYNDALKDGHIAGPGADDIIAILTKYTRIKDPKIYRDMVPFAANPNGQVNKTTLANDWDFFKSRGLISGHVTVDRVIDNSFADEAVRQLGLYKPKS
jgi:NitT/TauT family transport system substrate-binding protein